MAALPEAEPRSASLTPSRTERYGRSRDGPDHFFVHIGTQYFGYNHAAILLLKVFDNRHPGAAHRQSAAIERVHVLGFLAVAVTDAGAAGLEGFIVGAGGDFLIGILSRQPDLNIVGLGGVCSQIAGTQHNGAEGEPQADQDVFGIGGEFVQFLVALFGPGELDQLYLLELMLADDAANVAAIGAGLAAETRGVGAKLDRQVVFLQRFVAVNVGDGNLRGGDQPEIAVLAFEQVGSELGELRGAVEAGGVDQERTCPRKSGANGSVSLRL